jgi:hypothetical protein
VGEAALRLLDASYYWAVAKRPDPYAGWRPAPGVSAWQDLEGRALVRTNALGYRDREHPLEKPPGTLRVAVLGDSFTEAVQVPVEETVWARLGAALPACEALGGRTVEVLNFAVSGYSTAQSLLTYRHRVRPFRPDLVLLVFFAGNDLVENVRELDGDPLRPYFVIEGEGPARVRLALDDRFLGSGPYRALGAGSGRLWSWLTEHFRLAQLAVKARDVWQVRQAAQAGAAAGSELDEPGVDERVYGPPRDPLWAQAWDVTERLLTTLAREVEEDGATLVVATASTGAQVHPDSAFRAAFMRAHGIEDLFYPERRIAALSRAEGFLAVPLAREMHALASFSGAWLHGFANSLPGAGHWNTEGHRLAADLIANSLCREGGRPAVAGPAPAQVLPEPPGGE